MPGLEKTRALKESRAGAPEPRAKKRRAAPCPPPVEMRPKLTEIHGMTLSDDYAWLKADNWQDVLRDPAVLPADIRAVIEGENAYADARLAPVRALRRALVKEMRARIKEDDSDAPAPDGPWLYYTRHRAGGQHGLVCRRKRAGGAEQILLNADRLGRGKPFFSMLDARHSPDHRLLAWSTDDKGSEFHTIHIRDLAAKKDLAETVADTEGVIVWNAGSTGFYYVRLDDQHRPSRVFFHRVGQDSAGDELIFEEPDPGWFVIVRKSHSGDFAVISVRDHDSSENHLIDLRVPGSKPRLVEPRQNGLRYDLEHHGGDLLIRTNADGAEDFKIVKVPVDDPQRKNWRDHVPHRRGRMIVTGTVFEKFFVRLEREDGLPRMVVQEIAGGAEHVVSFDEQAYYLGFDEMLEFDTEILRFSYSSMTTPTEIYDYNMRTRERVLVKRDEIPSGHDPQDYVTERVFAPAPDGELVPVSLLYKKGLRRDGSAPVFLNGYGAYGFARDASFVPHRLSLADRGFVFALTHVRGGTDKGWHWYAGGKLEHKPNTFTDFIAAGEFLAREKYGGAGRIVAHGGSAGGMLMGAVANLAPKLFKGIIADVPFVDVLNTMMDAELPLTPPEWLEWGNPIASRAAFDAIRAYSPYDNVRAQDYPIILALAGLTDPRVTYWEPAKWVARLREKMTGGGPVMLKTNMEAGHGGASGRFDRLEDVALEYAFAIGCMAEAFMPDPAGRA